MLPIILAVILTTKTLLLKVFASIFLILMLLRIPLGILLNVFAILIYLIQIYFWPINIQKLYINVIIKPERWLFSSRSVQNGKRVTVPVMAFHLQGIN